MNEDLTKLVEDALTAAYEKGLGDKSEDKEAWLARAAVAALAKKVLVEAVGQMEITNKDLRSALETAEDRLETIYWDGDD